MHFRSAALRAAHARRSLRLAVPPPARRDRGTAQDLCVLAYPGWVSIERQQRTIGFSFRRDLCLGSRLHGPHTATPGVPAVDTLFNTTPPASPPAAVVHIDARNRRTSVSQLGLRPTTTTGHPDKKSSRRDALSTSELVCWSQLTNLSWTQACRMSLQSSAGQPSCANSGGRFRRASYSNEAKKPPLHTRASCSSDAKSSAPAAAPAREPISVGRLLSSHSLAL